VTARAYNDIGLASLTALNQRLIAQTVEDEESIAETEDALFGGYTPPEVTEEEQVEQRGRFSIANPLEFNRIKEWLESNIFAGQTGMSPLIGAFVNEWDVEYREMQGWSPEENIGDGATLERLLEDDRFINGALWLPLTGTNGVPPVFESVVEGEDGESLPVVAVASPLTGVEFITEEVLPTRPALMYEMARRGSEAAVAAVKRAMGSKYQADLAAEGDTRGRRTQGGSPRPGADLREGGVGKVTGINWANFVRSMAPAPGVADRPLPTITQDELVSALTAATGSRSSGGGGGGGTRRDIAFDRNHLIAQVSDRWRDWMFDPNEPPLGWIGSQVDSYIREARAFWSGKGGQLDFETYINDKLRAHPRYKEIYRYKGANESEEQFKARFAQPIAQLGMSSEFTREQTEAALTSGAGPAEQLKRISRSAEVEGAGGFSRRLGETLAGLGI
jgi:hypothetical protein